MQKEYWKLGTLGPQIEDEDLQVTPASGMSDILYGQLGHNEVVTDTHSASQHPLQA